MPHDSASRLSAVSELSDRDLILETARLVAREHAATADLLAALAELDARRLYLSEGCSSLFTYCTQVLHLSEPAAYSRITAARTLRRFPMLLPMLRDGAVSLTAVSLLAAHLTDDNHEHLLNAARYKTKREVDLLVASLHPQPDIASSVRRVPAIRAAAAAPAAPLADCARPATTALLSPSAPAMTPARPVVTPLGPERYYVRITVSRETHDKLQRARDLLRHTIPTGDLSAVIDRALDTLLERLEKTKLASASRPRRTARPAAHTRHVPAVVKRAVWARDGGRCAFDGPHGRCAETGFLEFHHVRPFADGGPATVDNLQLRCRAHNAHEAREYFNLTAG